MDVEFSSKGLGARTFLVAASIGLAACSSISDETLNGADAEDHLEVTTTSGEPVITVAPTVQTTDRDAAAADGDNDEAEVAAAPTTTAPTPTTEAPTTQAPSTTVEAAMVAVDTDDEENAAAAQLQDDDEEELESLPNTGANETMLVIAIGCALIVGGRTLIDLVNQAARSIHRIPVRTRTAPPR